MSVSALYRNDLGLNDIRKACGRYAEFYFQLVIKLKALWRYPLSAKKRKRYLISRTGGPLVMEHGGEAAIVVPFDFSSTLSVDRVAVIFHCFYVDLVDEFMQYFKNIPCDADFFISTDSAEKAEEIKLRFFGQFKGSIDIRIVPNRGRDVAPKFVTFADVYERYNIFVHLHTKQSARAGAKLAGWRGYFLETLLGSPKIIISILTLLQDPKIGIVFPATYKPIRPYMSWGRNAAKIRPILARFGLTLSLGNNRIEFPSGSMFWGRSNAIKPILDLGLTFDDFDLEAGQVDGTLAHAIERVILYSCEVANLEWRKISKPYLAVPGDTLIRITSLASIKEAREKVFIPVIPQVPGD
ncbi:rhamnan synthesis F family protein [Hyphomicrobium sp.]|jgi:lipopolysaccharide biosynthesis protein|uniref:rhamnan synthesis F family protein n=1 Tax=Hyphomicrobium sp. TaxID=82 RepID=UPI003561C164